MKMLSDMGSIPIISTTIQTPERILWSSLFATDCSDFKHHSDFCGSVENACRHAHTYKLEEIPVEIRFYTIADLQEMLGWSETTVQKLFKDPNFPSSDFGKNKVVESSSTTTIKILSSLPRR